VLLLYVYIPVKIAKVQNELKGRGFSYMYHERGGKFKYIFKEYAK